MRPRSAGRNPLGSIDELRARGDSEAEGDYQAVNESYEMLIPPGISAETPVGLMIWISSGASGALPDPGWAQALAAHQLVWIGPNQAGNDRRVPIRMGLALDAWSAAGREVTLDNKRIYVGGVSGGAKSALRVLLYYPEIFRGALLAAGIEYFRTVPTASEPGNVWRPNILVPRALAFAKTRSIAVTTGPKDFNFLQISDVAVAMRQDGFAHVTVLCDPGLGHAPPMQGLFEQALNWIDPAAGHGANE